MAPPYWLVWEVERRWPGGYAAFLIRLQRGVTVPVTVTSWWRDRERNERVGGHPESQHLIGWAVDLAPRNFRDLGPLGANLGTTGLTVVPGGSYVHAQLLPSGYLPNTGLLELPI